MKTGAVIVAAGLSSQMKSFKPMLQLSGSNIIKTEITTLLSAGMQEIVVVTGNEAELLEKHLSSTGVTCLYNPEYTSKDMFYSVCMGLSYIKSRCDRVFLLPADIPLFSAQSLFVMLGYMDCNSSDILLPTCKGKSGHPILIKCGIIPKLTGYSGPDGLKGAIDSYSGSKSTIELDDVGLMLDADKPEDFDRLSSYIKGEIVKTPLSCVTKVSIQRRQPFFDDELFDLLRLVEKHSSLHKACEEMGMAYTKGWKLVKIAEHQLGFLLLECRIGGSFGGGSTLTEKCRLLMQNYEDLCADTAEYAQNAFNAYFKDYSLDAAARQ
jgi:molybdenum cofactor cytidylyltransferase